MNKERLTLGQWICQPRLASCNEETTSLFEQISIAAKQIHKHVSRAGLTGLHGGTGRINIQGEKVQKLDVLADHTLTKILRRGNCCAGVASEEKDEILVFDDPKSKQSSYVVMFDPLDGSDNIDASLPVGTIFGIYRRRSRKGTVCTISDFLQPGSEQVAAGYCLYGCAAVLVLATRSEVNGFTLDSTTGEFVLSHPRLRCPENGCIYSFNQGYFHQYNTELQGFINTCGQPLEGGKMGTQRYIGSLVADVHRILLKGGIFMYPATRLKPKGKLRLLYECNPIAFMIEVAGGQATSGKERISDIQPLHLHEVSPVYIGSRKLIDHLVKSLRSPSITSLEVLQH